LDEEDIIQIENVDSGIYFSSPKSRIRSCTYPSMKGTHQSEVSNSI
jgi:hypothetical protein